MTIVLLPGRRRSLIGEGERRFSSKRRSWMLGGIDVRGTSFTFDGGEGKLLSGVLEAPEGTPRGWAIFAHCFTCGKDSLAAVHIGGLGSGLSPYELVSAGLAACTVMTMRLYANRKGFPLERASTRVEHKKVADMMPPDRFTRTIVLEGPLDDEQRARILEIADRCPVDLTLIRGSDVQTELVDSPESKPGSEPAA